MSVPVWATQSERHKPCPSGWARQESLVAARDLSKVAAKVRNWHT